MKKMTPAASPDAYVVALFGWRRECVESLRAAVRAVSALEEVVKWGHLVYLANGPALLIRAEEERVLFGFWRGQRLSDIEPRLKKSGKYEMATLDLREGMTIKPSIVRRLAREAVALNQTLGNPTQAAKPASKKGNRSSRRMNHGGVRFASSRPDGAAPEVLRSERISNDAESSASLIRKFAMPVDTHAATDRLMRFLAVEGVTGKEAAIGRELSAALREGGVPDSAIRLDDANTRIPVPTETGNLIVDLPGRGAMHNQPRIMFMTHMDTVPLCAGAKPKLSGRKIVNEAKTALGGDNRCGCGVLVTLAAELAKQNLDHPPITLLFCVREESGLYGARHVKTAELGSPVMAFNYDGGSASNVTIGAVGADRWQVEIFGRASHAGVAPERGISSTMILALALAEVKAGGWFGKVVKGKRR